MTTSECIAKLREVWNYAEQSNRAGYADAIDHAIDKLEALETIRENAMSIISNAADIMGMTMEDKK